MSSSEQFFVDIATSRLLPGDQYPATKVIYDLLQHIGADVSGFRRNYQASYRLVESARDLHDSINLTIKHVEESGDWDAYDAYSQVIDPFEGLLLALISVANEEQNEYVTAASSIEACKQSIEKWAKNRDLIRSSLHELRSSKAIKVHKIGQYQVAIEILVTDTVENLKSLVSTPEDREDDALHTYAQDDRGFLNNVLSEIQINTSSIKQQKTQVKVKQGVITLVIKCGMIVYGITKIIVEKLVGQDRLDYYHSDKVWDAAQRLVGKLADSLQFQKFTSDELENEYSAFEGISLRVSVTDTPESYCRLIRLIGKIGRAYHAQSLELVLLCREAVTRFQSNKSTSNYNAVESALKKTVEALEAATEVASTEENDVAGGTNQGRVGPESDITETAGCSLLGSVESQDFGVEKFRLKLYDNSALELRTCFQEIGVTNTNDPLERLEVARRKDQARVKQVKEKLAGKFKPERVKATIRVYENKAKGDPVTVVSCHVPSGARFSFIMWNLAKQLPGFDLTNPETAYFEKPGAGGESGTRISPEDSIQMLSSGDKEITLLLIVSTTLGGYLVGPEQ